MCGLGKGWKVTFPGDCHGCEVEQRLGGGNVIVETGGDHINDDGMFGNGDKTGRVSSLFQFRG